MTTVPTATQQQPGLAATAVTHGPGLAAAVARAVAGAQQGDPLRPVTVIVPTRTAGVALRRQVAVHLGGVAAVRFELLARAAELLAAPSLAAAGRRPLRQAVLHEAVRAVLHEQPGRFAQVADHPATARAIGRTVQELSAVPPERLNALTRARGREAARLSTAVRARLGGRYDRHDLARAAADVITRAPETARELGPLVVLLDRRLSPAECTLLAALAELAPVRLLVARTGEPTADAGVLATLAALGVPAPDAAEGPEPAGTTVLSAPDPETEVRAAVRRIAARLDSGTPLHRMALLWTADRPYALLVRDALAAAGLPANGGPRPRLADTPTGRALLGLLRLAAPSARPLARDEVVAWLSAAPLRRTQDGPPVDGARWDAVSRRAGVVAGPAEWRARLERYATLIERRARDEVHDGAPERLLAAADQEAGHARALAAFVDELHRRLAPPSGGWAVLSDWALALLDRYVGEPRADWDDGSVEADRLVRAAVRGLAELDGMGPAVDLAAFRRAVEGELDERTGRRGRLGEGLLIGPLRDGLAQELDLVVVVGLVEGLAPPKTRDDPVLPDRERAVVEGLPLRAEQPAALRRDLLAALAAGRERLLCVARSDNRAGRERMPSRWLLEVVGRLTGRPVHSEDLARLRGADWLDWVGSSAPVGGAHPAGSGELLTASLARWRADGLEPVEHPLAAGALARGFEALRDRRRGVFGRWTGLVGAVPGLELGAAPLSPSRLQTWAACPFRSYLERVLGVEELVRPEDTVRIDPREWGNLLHRILERFVAEGAAPAHGAAWGAAERERLRAIADEEADRVERSGLTGKRLLWRLDRARLHRVLDAFLRDDERMRAEAGSAPIAAERAFGFGDEPVVLTLASGRTLAFRGYVDRVDTTADGGVVVLDYKTGVAADRYADALAAHPVGNGQLLQLPVYALAAGPGASSVRAAYWFLNDQGVHEIAWTLDDENEAAFREAVTTIADGMEHGLYPQRVGHEWTRGRTSCERCAYELVCDRDRERRWPAVRLLPVLDGLERLDGGDSGNTGNTGNGEQSA